MPNTLFAACTAPVRARTLALGLLGLLVASSAQAQPAERASDAPTHGASAQDRDCALQRRNGGTCTLTMDSEQVGADRPVASGDLLNFRRFADRSSLIRLRKEFVAEIVRSAADLD